jgi:DNA-binding SARP family transcriptional activator
LLITMPRPTDVPESAAGATNGGPVFTLAMLGGWRMTRDGEPVHLPSSAQRLVAFTGLNDSVSRAYIAGTLWPEVTDHRAHASLRSTIWRVSQTCRGLLESHGEVLSLARGTWVDVRELRSLFEVEPPGSRSGSGVASWSESFWGELLPGWYDDWVMLERERLRQMRVHALETMTRALADQGRYAEALEVGMAAVAVAPLRESAHREIIRIHLAEGNLSEALRQFEVCAQLLRADLGLEPSDQMVDLLEPVMDLRRASLESNP